MPQPNKIEPPPKAIFFDAAGTLFNLPRGVGYHYALVAAELGLKWDSRELDRAFNSAWHAMPSRAAIDGPRFIWWNFVSSRRERIEQAKADWKLRRFDSVSGDDTEFIPLPE